MKTKLKLTALVLAAVTVISLFAGCNKNKSDDNNGMPEYIYIPTYYPLDFDFEEGYVGNTAKASDGIYILVNERDGTQKREDTYTDENGKVINESYDEPRYVTRLYKTDFEGKNLEKLPNFEFENNSVYDVAKEVYGGISYLFVTVEGNPGVLRYENITTIDLPEDFDPSKDDKWQYEQHYTSTYYFETFDSTGKTLVSKEISKITDGEEGMSADYLSFDSKGNVYVGNWRSFEVYSPDLSEKLFASKEEMNIDGFVKLSDGSVGISLWGESGMEIKRIDPIKKELGEKISAPQNAYNFIEGKGEYILFYYSAGGIMGLKEDGTAEEIVNWLDSDIENSNINGIIPMEDGNFVVISASYDEASGKDKSELVKLTKTKYDPTNERKIINIACMYLDYDVRQKVLDFNKTNTEYRIRMTDYSQYNTGDDNSAGITKLNTEIIAGHIPDIFIVQGVMPISQYSGKGVLEDLTPYMERDFGKDAFVEEFFNTLRSEDGKLYEIYSHFTVSTAMGLKKIVGDSDSWTFEDMKNALAKLPEGATVMDDYYFRENAVQAFMYNNMNRFVDWSTGKCSFDTQEFIDLLNFVKSFPTQEEVDASHNEDYKWEPSISRVSSGKQLLLETGIYSLDDFRGNTFYLLDGEPSFVGYPGMGSSFVAADMGFAISAKSEYKDTAWDFIKYLLTAEYQEDRIWNGLPTNKAAFEKLFEASKTPNYIDPALSDENAEDNAGIDAREASAIGGGHWEENIRYSEFNKGTVNEQGWKEEPKTYTWYYDGDDKEWEIPVFAMTEQEEQAIRSLISGITVFSRYDRSLSDIIDEEIQPFFEGQKSAEDTAKMIQSRATIYVNEQR